MLQCGLEFGLDAGRALLARIVGSGTVRLHAAQEHFAVASDQGELLSKLLLRLELQRKRLVELGSLEDGEGRLEGRVFGGDCGQLGLELRDLLVEPAVRLPGSCGRSFLLQSGDPGRDILLVPAARDEVVLKVALSGSEATVSQVLRTCTKTRGATHDILEERAGLF